MHGYLLAALGVKAGRQALGVNEVAGGLARATGNPFALLTLDPTSPRAPAYHRNDAELY
ncbi:hypothetical protein [Streptomyces sp. NPDC037389]|uniref:hypothetical protein n=1 Tax=Streptomyces sp. NPDC037389 TaxID=3155369 RepID=UPI00340919DD